MSHSRSSLIGLWFVQWGEFSPIAIAEVTDQSAQNLFLTNVEHLSTGKVSVVARIANEFNGVTLYCSRDEAMKSTERKHVK